ncbi:hypothetical protein N7447_008585 [Penicillium robsamsonii]|uniref:uncharacterized protein n=1 Tax=Penicillium robsamsonii TaxID=1792511 RepID=UPI0025487E25|nr:uncharacterized protein N7447_008585 [Penicillium robsamsonii]KAJ5816352.1 hypothetical protein N7447_008585 [Penicillium robsamsonii]
MSHSGRDEEWLRAQLHALRGPGPNEKTLQPLKSKHSATWSNTEVDQSVLLLTQASEERRHGEIKTTMNSAKIKRDKWTYEDYGSVLRHIVGPGSVPVGVIESVLHLYKTNQPKKARTGSLKWRKSATEDETDSLMADLMTTALANNRLDQLRVLSHFAGSDVVSRVMPMAIWTNNIEGVQVLMEENADTNTCPKDFLNSVVAGKLDFVRLLLRSQRPVSNSITTQALPTAVKLGNIEMVQLLLAHGANPNFDNGLALKNAADADRADIIILLLLCKIPPTGALLGSVILYVWSEPDIFGGRQYQLIEVLLNGGACGNDVDVVLLGSVAQCWGELTRLLMSKGTSIACCDGKAYRQAVHAVDYDMLEILNMGNLGKDLASDIFGSIDSTRFAQEISPEDWRKLALSLLTQGATGDVVHEALVSRVEARDLESVILLLDSGASVDYEGGNALIMAVLLEELDYLVLLLRHKPSIESVNAAFAHVSNISHHVQLDMTRRLLEAGATGASVDAVLNIAVNLPACQRNHMYIEALVDGGADVGQKEGSLFHEAVLDGDDKTLEILLGGKFQTATLFTCIPLAMKLDERWQYKVLEILLDNGAKGGPVIGQALVDSIDETKDSSIRVTELLLKNGDASTAFNKGEALRKATLCRNLAFLKLLLQFNHLDESEFCSCLLVAIGLPRDHVRPEKVKLFLAIGVGMSNEYWITSLNHEMQCMRQDDEETLVVIRFLLDAGANVNHNHGEILCNAIDMGYLECFKLYLGCKLLIPSHEAAFTKAFAYVMKTTDLRYMKEVLKLKTPTLLLNGALLTATEIGEQMRDVCELLLEHHASPSHKSGAPLCNAIKSKNYQISIVKLLLDFQPSSEAIAAALDCAFDALGSEKRLGAVNLLLTSAKPQATLDELLLRAVQEPSCDRYLLKSLLRAAMKNDIKSLRILQRYFRDQSAIVSRVFEHAWVQGARAELQEPALSLLLEAGATGKCLSVALVDTIEEFKSSPKSLALITKLLSAGADVNFDNGVSLVKAAGMGNIYVLKELFAHYPHRDHMTLAFPNIFGSGVSSQMLLAIVKAFCSHQSHPSLTNTPHPILFLLLRKYPQEKEIVKYLIDAGCPVDPPVETEGGTYLSLLHWALIEDMDRICDKVFDILLDAGANPNFKTASGLTPLEIAISIPRRGVVASLIRHKADATVSTGAMNPRSMLFLAVTTGDSDIVRSVMLASPMVRDGALHEAAREVNVKIVEVLVREGNQRDYAYSGCNGRTALAELCLRADGNEPVHELKRAMTLLKDDHNFRMKSHGKSALHLALDNLRNAPSVTRALLDSFMADYVNDDINLYEEDGLLYSPLAYVAKHRNKAPSTYDASLLRLLAQFGCRNRFWARAGHPQPADVIDPPDDIYQLISDQKSNERMLARIRCQSEEAQVGIAKRHELILKNEQNAADQRAKLEKEAEARCISIATSRHAAERAHMEQLARVAELANAGYRSSVNLKLEDPLAQYAKLDRKRQDAELEHLRKQQALITAGCKERAEIEKKNREANALEMRRLRELWFEIDPWD